MELVKYCKVDRRSTYALHIADVCNSVCTTTFADGVRVSCRLAQNKKKSVLTFLRRGACRALDVILTKGAEEVNEVRLSRNRIVELVQKPRLLVPCNSFAIVSHLI